MVPVILASTSVYRQRLLSQLNLPFSSQPPVFDEAEAKKNFQGEAKELCQYLGKMKARSLATADNCVIGSDQMAVLKNSILDKPGNLEKAFQQLTQMQGQEHLLLTSLTVIFCGQEVSLLNETKLTLKSLTSEQINNYLLLDQPFDCAGSYKIEQHGIALMQKIATDDFTAIQGLPLLQLARVLGDFGYQIPGGTK